MNAKPTKKSTARRLIGTIAGVATLATISVASLGAAPADAAPRSQSAVVAPLKIRACRAPVVNITGAAIYNDTFETNGTVVVDGRATAPCGANPTAVLYVDGKMVTSQTLPRGGGTFHFNRLIVPELPLDRYFAALFDADFSTGTPHTVCVQLHPEPGNSQVVDGWRCQSVVSENAWA